MHTAPSSFVSFVSVGYTRPVHNCPLQMLGSFKNLEIILFSISKMLDMELMTAADILQEATLKMAMLYETHPNDAMFAVRDYFSGAEADALVQTGMWMRHEGWLIPSKHNLYYRYLYNNNLRGVA